MDTEYDFRIKFKGTKEQYYEFFKDYRSRREYHYTDPFIWVPDTEVFDSKSNDLLILWDRVNRRKTLAFIKVQELPENGTLLWIHFNEKNYPIHKEYWELLNEELVNQKWVSNRKEEVYMPKRPADLAKWQKAYPILDQTRREFIIAFEKGYDPDPAPKYEDFQDALGSRMGWKPKSRKTIQAILLAGDEKLLN